MRKTIAVLALGSALAGCNVNQADATRILQSQGMSDVVLDGYAWFGCGQEDDYATNFHGKDVHGNPVSGVICAGPFKGYTVRFN